MKVLGHHVAPSFGYPSEQRQMILIKDSGATDKMQVMRALAMEGALDPAVREQVMAIVAKCPPKDSLREAAAILKWVQENIRYLAELSETFQTAVYTLQHKAGDCDDQVILFVAMCESIRIPTVITAIGRKQGLATDWFHVYAKVGWPQRIPTHWIPAEPTLKVPLGWDPEKYARDNEARALATL